MNALNVREELSRVRAAILAREEAFRREFSQIHEIHRGRARNLVHYAAFRECVHEALRDQLEMLGLDPLRNAEWDVLARVDRVLHRLEREVTGDADHTVTPRVAAPESGKALLRERTDALFGSPPAGRDVRIMMTLSPDAVDGPARVREFASGGADCFRINCARDDSHTWERVIEHVRSAGDGQRKPLLFMDLGGAKLRVASWARDRKGARLHLGDSFLIDTGLGASDDGAALDGDRPKKIMKVNDPTGLSGVQPGQRVWFDDGKVGGIVREVGGEGIRVEVTHAKRGGRKLRIERGLNLPDSTLNLPALTAKDLEDLAIAAPKADFVALSFIRTVDDVEAFRQRLTGVPNASPALVIKIETLEAVTHLPELMIAAMRHDRVAFLLARGDLAVECGFLELPRIQQDVVRFCAAASMPLFWATGVMERASRTGEPSRAEITDVEEAAHAQCIMLNKGPRIADALRLLRAQLERRRTRE